MKSARWFVVAGHCDLTDVRDIKFAVACLSLYGVPDENITIVADFQAPMYEQFGIEYLSPKVVHKPSLLPALLNAVQSEDVILIVAGHGSQSGLGTTPRVSPYGLLTMIREIPGLKRCLVVLGQCFAGIFNYVEARQRVGGKVVEPDVAIMGATSLSLATAENLADLFALDEHIFPDIVKGLVRDGSWPANYFLFFFFVWLLEEEDVDGDGKCTAMDAFKWASIKANECTRLTRGSSGLEGLLSLQTTDDGTGVQGWLKSQAGLDAKKKFAEMFESQDPWILNAELARSIIF